MTINRVLSDVRGIVADFNPILESDTTSQTDPRKSVRKKCIGFNIQCNLYFSCVSLSLDRTLISLIGDCMSTYHSLHSRNEVVYQIITTLKTKELAIYTQPLKKKQVKIELFQQRDSSVVRQNL